MQEHYLKMAVADDSRVQLVELLKSAVVVNAKIDLDSKAEGRLSKTNFAQHLI